jgi:DNA-binding beta-propeller fold protein YncE
LQASIDFGHWTKASQETFGRPEGLAFDKDTGDLYVAESAKNLISVIKPDGTRKILTGSGKVLRWHTKEC